jgi:protein tyrosine/serine phosphatase
LTDARHRRPLRLGALALGVVLLVAVGSVVRHRLGPKHLLTVTPGVLYRSGQLTPEQLADVVDRYGIRTVVNLRAENEYDRDDWYRDEVATTEQLGAAHVDLPMNAGFPPSDEVLSAWLDLLDDPAAQPLLVHCEHGVIRTGIMVGVYEVEKRSLAATEALSRFERFGHDFPERVRERIDAWFAHYVPRRASG